MKRYILLFMSALSVAIVIIGLLSAQTGSNNTGTGVWQLAGADLSNSRNQPSESILNPANVSTLKPIWTFTTGGDVSATPTVDGDTIYVPDWAGNLFAISRSDGK